VRNKFRECDYRVAIERVATKVEEMAKDGWIEFSRVMVNFTSHQQHGARPQYRIVFRKLDAGRKPRTTGLQKRMSAVRASVATIGVKSCLLQWSATGRPLPFYNYNISTIRRRVCSRFMKKLSSK
jgi:hypothetical protein